MQDDGMMIGVTVEASLKLKGADVAHVLILGSDFVLVCERTVYCPCLTS